MGKDLNNKKGRKILGLGLDWLGLSPLNKGLGIEATYRSVPAVPDTDR